jgi:hypothetical protein
MTMMTHQSLGKNLYVFCNLVPTKPDNKLEGIPPNYTNPHGLGLRQCEPSDFCISRLAPFFAC